MFFITLFSMALAHAATTATPQDCLKITDELDRKYCLDKRLQVTKTALEAEKKTWAKGLNGDAKEARTEALQAEVALKKEFINYLQSEINLSEKQMENLSAVTVTAPAAPKKKKKEKKKGGFRIKL